MSIDLSYPLVASMSQHDPLDGLITYSELQATARKYSGRSAWPDLSAEIADMADICTGKSLITDDPLGLGGLLTGAYKIAQLVIEDNFITTRSPGDCCGLILNRSGRLCEGGLFKTAC